MPGIPREPFFNLHRGKKITERELEIIRLITQELTNPQIGRFLGISHLTVRNHITNCTAKLETRTRTGLAVWYALNYGNPYSQRKTA